MIGRLLLVICFLIQSCAKPDVVIFVDDFSEPLAWIIDSLVKVKHPHIKLKISVGKADFLAQSIYLGRKADFFITGKVEEFYGKSLHINKSVPIASDAVVLAAKDSSIHTWNDVVTKKKIISVPMKGVPIYNFWKKWREYEKIDEKLLEKRYYTHPKTAEWHILYATTDVEITLASRCNQQNLKVLDYYEILEPVHILHQMNRTNPQTQIILNLINLKEFKEVLRKYGYKQ